MQNFLVERKVIESHNAIPMPTLTDIRGMLRKNWHSSVKDKVLGAYIIGSTSTLTNHSDSDIDIAIIIGAKKKSAIQFTDHYHSKFLNNNEMPNWEGRRVDFQFFYSANDLCDWQRMDCSI